MQYTKIKTGYSANGAEIAAYSNVSAAEKYHYLIAGVHGDEPEGVFVLEKLFDWLQQQSISKPLIIIPQLNPDGLTAKTRVNGNAVDLNRNWPSSDWSATYKEPRYNPGPTPLSEPENVFLASLFEQFQPSLIFSFHSWLPLLDCNALAKTDAKYIAQYNNYQIVDDIGYPTPGSLGAYTDELLKCGILTYELPVISVSLSLQDIWLENEAGLKNYFSNCS